MERITIGEVREIAFRLAKRFMEYDEPIPPFETRFGHVLESSLAVPFLGVGGRAVYKGLVGKASILFYLLVKNHPFRNGNKRVAMTTFLVFLFKNKKWLDVDPYEFYNFVMWVTASPAKLKEEVTLGIKKFIKLYLVNLEK